METTNEKTVVSVLRTHHDTYRFELISITEAAQKLTEFVGVNDTTLGVYGIPARENMVQDAWLWVYVNKSGVRLEWVEDPTSTKLPGAFYHVSAVKGVSFLPR